MKKEKSTIETLKVIFVVIGAVVSLAALAAVVYTIFKKYFQVTFECDGDCDDCGDDCFGECESNYEPICAATVTMRTRKKKLKHPTTKNNSRTHPLTIPEIVELV